MLLCSCPQGYREIGPTCTTCRLPRRPWGGSGHWLCGPPRPAACCGRGPIRGRLWDDSAGIQGKEPRAAAS